MAGCAIALAISEQSFEPDGMISLKMPCVVCDDSNGLKTTIGLDVRFDPGASVQDIGNAIEDEILYRVSVDPIVSGVSIARTRMIYFTPQKGQ